MKIITAMFFWLSKLLSFLITPLTWILICLLLALFLKNVKLKKRFLITGVFLFMFFTNSYITNAVLHAWE
ncbi:MAG: YdcF family protein, partial [Bacteroidota bacterium]